MNLYLLEPNDGLPYEDNPWEPWFDKCFGVVVAANNEDEARIEASEASSDEGEDAWLKSEYSTCVLIGTATDGTERRTILQSINYA